jgi:hypothetical protein
MRERGRFFAKPGGLELYCPLQTRKHLCPKNKNDRNGTVVTIKERRNDYEKTKQRKNTIIN